MNRNSTPKCDFIHEQGFSKITIPNRFVTEENKDFQWVQRAGTSDGLGIQKQKFWNCLNEKYSTIQRQFDF